MSQRHCRVCIVAVLLAVALPPGARAGEPAKLRLDDSFPADVRRDLQTVAEDVLDAARRRMPGQPPAGERPLVLAYRAAGPMTNSTDDPTIYRLYLSEKGRDYVRFTYQLAHELGHVMLDPRRSNGLIETLAVALSLQILDDMTDRWERDPPRDHWQSYAPEFRKYRVRTEKSHLDKFPLEVQALVERKSWPELALYLRYRRADQDRDMNERDLNHLGAIALRSAEVDWKEFIGLAGQTSPSPKEDRRYRSDLQIDPKRLPASVARFGRNHPADFLVAEFDKRPTVKEGLVLGSGSHWLWLLERDAIDGAELERIMGKYQPAALRWERGSGKGRP